MKKFTVAVVIIAAFILYSLMYSHSAVVLPNSSTDTGSSSGSSKQSSPTSIGPTPSATGDTASIGSTPSTTGNTSSGQYKNGSYTGSVEDAQWGYIQVQAIIQDGKITDVKFLQAPNDRNRSIAINSYADPQLTTEAIQVQSSNVDVVTGATDSSDAFIQSLANALSQAKA